MRSDRFRVLAAACIFLAALFVFTACSEKERNEEETAAPKEEEEETKKAGEYRLAKSSVLAGEYQDEMLVTITDKGKIQKIPFLTYQELNVIHAADGSRALVWLEGKLSLTDGSKLTEICRDEVLKKEYRLSLDGSVVWYLREEKTGGADLYYWKKNKSVKVAELVEPGSVVISPDGSAAAFTFLSARTNKHELFYWDGKKITEVGLGLSPIAVSNGAGYLYYWDAEENQVCVLRKGKTTSLFRSSGTIGRCLLNEDGSEVLFCDGDRVRYVSKGGEAEAVGTDKWLMLVPDGCVTGSYTCSQVSAQVLTYGVETLTGKYYRSGETGSEEICCLTKREGRRTVATRTKGAAILEDGKTIFYIRSDDLYKRDASKENAEAQLIAEDVMEFRVTSDGKTVFWLDEGDRVMSRKGKGEAARIFSEAEEGSLVLLGGKTLCFLSDGELYVSTGGKAERAMKEYEFTDISATRFFLGLKTTDRTIVFSTDGKTVLFETD